jgi:photosystem II stability/assembly factor-like uncharacterized protein
MLLSLTLAVFFVAACTVPDSQISNFPASSQPATEYTMVPVMTETTAPNASMDKTATAIAEEEINATDEVQEPVAITIDHLQMMDGENGWGMDSEHRLLTTKNSGDSWQNVTPELGTYDWEGFFALDMQYAWLIPTRKNCATEVCSAYQIWRTTDGGKTWKGSQPLCTGEHCPAHNSTPVDFAKPVQINFLDNANGWMLLNINHIVDVDHYRIYRTQDGGENWEFVIDHNDGPVTYQVTGISFFTENNGWLSTSDLSNMEMISPNWFIYRSYDGGESWRKYQVPELNKMPKVFSEYEYSCGAEKLEVTSADMLDFQMRCIVFAEEDMEFIFHYHTLTGGKNWSRWQIQENADFVSVVSGWQIQKSESGGYVLQHTTDGGANWQDISDVPWLGELHFVNDSVGFALVRDDENKGLYRTGNGGLTWTEVETMLTEAPAMQLAEGGIREIFLSGPNGQTFPVVYYPPSVSSAPAIILMHQVNMDMNQWNAIAPWLWKMDASEYEEWSSIPAQDGSTPWLDSSWFPENTLKEKPAVFVFTYRDCNNGCGLPDTTKILDDAKTVINYAINQAEIDPERITVVGTSVSADAALDACFLIHRESGFNCQNVLSLSPGSYLDLEYVSVVKEMEKTPAQLYCFASRADSESAKLCMGNRPSDTYTYFVGKGIQHGIELFAPDYELNMLEKLIEIVGD